MTDTSTAIVELTHTFGFSQKIAAPKTDKFAPGNTNEASLYTQFHAPDPTLGEEQLTEFEARARQAMAVTVASVLKSLNADVILNDEGLVQVAFEAAMPGTVAEPAPAKPAYNPAPRPQSKQQYQQPNQAPAATGDPIDFGNGCSLQYGSYGAFITNGTVKGGIGRSATWAKAGGKVLTPENITAEDAYAFLQWVAMNPPQKR